MSNIQNKPTTNPRGNPNWRPGVSANPGGRPKHAAFSHAMRELLICAGEMPKTWDAEHLTKAQELAISTLEHAKSGSAQHLNIVLDRAEGRPAMADEDRDAMTATGAGGNRLRELLAGFGTHFVNPISLHNPAN